MLKQPSKLCGWIKTTKSEGQIFCSFAVADDISILYSETLEPGKHSAQSVQLLAVAKACELRVRLYTDSSYAYGVLHDFDF